MLKDICACPSIKKIKKDIYAFMELFCKLIFNLDVKQKEIKNMEELLNFPTSLNWKDSVISKLKIEKMKIYLPNHKILDLLNPFHLPDQPSILIDFVILG